MELAAFRPLRRASPTTMLVATFAISYLLQSIALVRFGAIGKIIVVIPKLSEPVTIAGVHIRWITIVTILVAVAVFAALTLLHEDHHRAPDAGRLHRLANCAPTRSPGECGDHGGCGRIRPHRGNRRGDPADGRARAAARRPDFALRETIIVLVGVVVGGIDRLWSATLGGFAMGFAVGALLVSCRAAARGPSRAACTWTRPCSCS